MDAYIESQVQGLPRAEADEMRKRLAESFLSQQAQSPIVARTLAKLFSVLAAKGAISMSDFPPEMASEVARWQGWAEYLE